MLKNYIGMYFITHTPLQFRYKAMKRKLLEEGGTLGIRTRVNIPKKKKTKQKKNKNKTEIFTNKLGLSAIHRFSVFDSLFLSVRIQLQEKSSGIILMTGRAEISCIYL